MNRSTKIAALSVFGAAILTPAAAQAATWDAWIQPSAPGVDVAGALPDWHIENGHAGAKAEDAIALSVAALGGKANAHASNLSGPAAIAVGEGAHVEAHGVNPGLAIGIAGPNTMVHIDGTTPVVCEGQAGFAGDFQTLTGCIAYTNIDGSTVTVPLSLR
ncbi:hypothetical protein [Corynebacterium pseudopelargi]|uniref:MspA n=1 Tax=Corynebacterium pseudopelargi TaxID=2080757 RepID=A0A3G6J0X0_9CORY|nr:hypothetical protein [Corynebacterium pseudopelargi]AZA09784.1 hypothetical protein CPPEL_08400 [Corynebacterium pseudopelargi]